MRTHILQVLLALVAAASLPLVAAENTTVEIGVLANGAKFIGDKTGGAFVVIATEAGNTVLAEGRTAGGTGSTDRIMRGEGGRYADLSSDEDAVFSAQLSLDEPTEVIIKASGPLGYPESAASAEKTVWLVPGRNLVGENRVLLELSGYIIEPETVNIDVNGKGRARVDLQMLCGCPITPGGTWDANRIEMRAVLLNNHGESGQAVPLVHTGEGTLFDATFENEFSSPKTLRIDLVGKESANTASRHIPLYR